MPDSNDNAAYDMHEILLRIFDDGDFLDVAARSSQAIITGYARVDGRTVARDRQSADAQRRARSTTRVRQGGPLRAVQRLVQHPLVFVVDTRGSCPAFQQEKNGIIKRGGRFPLRAVVEGGRAEGDHHGAQVLRRRLRGDGLKRLTTDLNFVWPTAHRRNRRR